MSLLLLFASSATSTTATATTANAAGSAPDAAVRISSAVTAEVGQAAGQALDAVAAQPWGPPSGLIATVISSTQIDLSWTPIAGAAGYDIERDGVVIATDVIGSSYGDTGLTPGTTYSYRARSVHV